LSEEKQAEVLAAFDTEKPLLIAYADTGTTLFRVYGGDSHEDGAWYACCIEAGESGRSASAKGLALPAGNTAVSLVEVRVERGTKMVYGTTAALAHGRQSRAEPGGGRQIYIPTFNAVVELRRYERGQAFQYRKVPAKAPSPESIRVEMELRENGETRRNEAGEPNIVYYWFTPVSMLRETDSFGLAPMTDGPYGLRPAVLERVICELAIAESTRGIRCDLSLAA
jgi:hypothetical protein